MLEMTENAQRPRWTYYMRNGDLGANPYLFADAFLEKHSAIASERLPGGLAYYDAEDPEPTQHHWLMGDAAKSELHYDVVRWLDDAGVYSIAQHNRCRRSVMEAVRCQKYSRTPFESAPQNLIEFANVTYDVTTRQFMPNQAKNYQSRWLPRSMKTSGFKKPQLTLDWLTALTGHNARAVQTLVRFIGYTLTNDTLYPQALFLHGFHACGKTTFANYLDRLFCCRMGIIYPDEFAHYASKQVGQELANSYFIQLGDIIEFTPKEQFGVRKTLDGHGDYTLRDRHSEFFGTRLADKFFVYGSHIPRVKDKPLTPYYTSVPFTANFEKKHPDPYSTLTRREFAEKYSPAALDAEADDFLYYCLQAYLDFEPMSINMDSLDRILTTCLEVSDDAAAQRDGDTITQLYKFYCAGMEQNQQKPITRIAFRRALEHHFGRQQIRSKHRGTQAGRIPGIILNDDAINYMVHQMPDLPADQYYGYKNRL